MTLYILIFEYDGLGNYRSTLGVFSSPEAAKRHWQEDCEGNMPSGEVYLRMVELDRSCQYNSMTKLENYFKDLQNEPVTFN